MIELRGGGRSASSGEEEEESVYLQSLGELNADDNYENKLLTSRDIVC